MIYVLVGRNGEPYCDPDTGHVFTFATEGEARMMARPGERVAGWIEEPGAPAGSWITVPLPARRHRPP